MNEVEPTYAVPGVTDFHKGPYVLVHGAWLSGAMYDAVRDRLQGWGLEVHAPTLTGNRHGDSKHFGLGDAITSLVDYFEDNAITDAVLVGHSYGGMVVTGAADRLPHGRVRRLVYCNAFVPYDGESLWDLNPPSFNEMFNSVKQRGGGMALPYPIWREALMNDADDALARSTYQTLNDQPYNAMIEKISLSCNPSAFPFGRAYIHCLDDVGYPQSQGGYHPKFTERLGLFRYLSMPGGHQVCFTNPDLLARKILEAGRD